METSKGGRMSFIEAVSAEQYLETHSLKAILQWVTHEVILNKPKSPLAFIRDLLTAKLNQQQGGGKNDIAMLVENAEISLSKCVQAAASSKDQGDRTRAAALLAGLRAKVDQLSEDLAPGKFSGSAALGSFRDRPTPKAIVTTNLSSSVGKTSGGGAIDLARSLATRGIRNKVTPTIGEEESDSDDDGESSEPDSPQTAHTPPEWKEEPGKSLEMETEQEGNATDDKEKKKVSPQPRMSARLGHWSMEDRCNAAFSKMDTDNDGLLTKQELEKALKQIGLQMTPRAMHQLLSKIDKNHDGEISREEFLEFYKNAREEGGDEIIDLDAQAASCCCGPGSLASLSRAGSSDGEDTQYTRSGHYKYAHLVSWCVHAREGFQRRKHLMGKAKQVSSDPDMNNYLKGNPLTDSGHSALSLSLLESRQEGSDPDANAKIINQARANWKIIPDDSWYLCWTLFTMVLILFYMGVVPVRLAFSEYAPDNEFVQGAEAWYWVDFIADSVFLVDIVMNFFVIIKHGNGEYLINFVDIAIFQIHSKWFYVDMVASIPTSYMNYATRDDWDKDDELLNEATDDGEGGLTQELSGVNKLLRLVRIIKLARVFRMVRFMKDFEDLAIVNPSSLRLVRLLVFFVIILHFVACGFWMLLSGDHFCRDDDTDHGECSADISWYIQKGTAESSSLTVQYMMAFYWAVSAMTGVGYDIEPRTYWQYVYTTAIIVCGMFMNAILIGSVPGAIENLDRVQSDRKRELDAINDYLRKQNVPAYLQRSVRSYYEYLHGCDHDMRLGEEERLASLPESLKTRVKVATAIRAIERIPLFSELHASCKIQIIHRLNPVIKVPGERLAIQDDVGEAMYIIKNGRVQLKRIPKPKRAANKWMSAAEKARKPVVLGHPPKEEKPSAERKGMVDVATKVFREVVKVAELGPGDFFGENCLLGRKNDTTAIAADYSDLLELTVDDCKELCEEYDELKEQITSTAKTRYLAHVPHEERHHDDIRHLEESIRLEKMQEGDVGVPLNGPAPSRLSTRRMTRLLMDEFADLSAQHGILGGMSESKHHG